MKGQLSRSSVIMTLTLIKVILKGDLTRNTDYESKLGFFGGFFLLLVLTELRIIDRGKIKYTSQHYVAQNVHC